MIKRDSYILGAILGIIIPLLIYAMFTGIVILAEEQFSKITFQRSPVIEMFSIAGNLIIMRYYFVNLKHDKTGRGILMVTFFLIIAFFAFYRDLIKEI